jgi:hypothetical protein
MRAREGRRWSAPDAAWCAPAGRLPADLHAFWRRTTESLQQIPLRATCTDAPAQSGREYVTSLVQLDSFEGKCLRAWYTVPKDPVLGGLTCGAAARAAVSLWSPSLRVHHCAESAARLPGPDAYPVHALQCPCHALAAPLPRGLGLCITYGRGREVKRVDVCRGSRLLPAHRIGHSADPTGRREMPAHRHR